MKRFVKESKMTTVMSFNEISMEEMNEVDGGLFVGAAVGAFGGAVVGAVYQSVKIACTIVTGGNPGTGKQQAASIVKAAKDSAITAAVVGFICGA